MSEIVISSASYLLPESYGNITRGHCLWGGEAEAAVVVSTPRDISWSSLFDTSCSRFGRMDLLSRLSVMAVELLGIDFTGMTEEARDRVGVCSVVPSGSVSTDIEFLENMSPSTFIYTLPSSAIGEICIRHRLKGPVLCLTSDESTGRTVLEEAAERMSMGEAESMLCLACDARTPAAERALNSELDNGHDSCWYACCLYLEREDKAHNGDKVTRTISDPSTCGMWRTCLGLCGDEPASARDRT